MKKMMTNMKTLVALLMAGAAVTSCSSDNEMDSLKAPAGKTYTMTVQATKGGDAMTRALADGGDGTLTATWATTENVYVKKGSDWATGSLKPQTAAASTTLKGELSDVTIVANDVLTLQFPKSGDITYAGQKGTLADIAENFDWAIAEDVQVASVDGDGNIDTGENAIEFEHQQAIVKFTLKKSDGTALPSNPTAFTMTDGTSTVELTNIPAGTYTTNGGDGVLYVAFPASNASADITLTATVGTDTYTCTASSKTFTIGNFYRVTAKMAEEPEVAGEYFTSKSDGTKVVFSPGNLQYQANTNTWRFAEHQYDYVGDASKGNVYAGSTKSNNANISSSYDGWIDLFGWGTSGKSFASGYGSAYQPWSTSKEDTAYGPTGTSNGLYGDFANGDWGVNMTGTYTWRTLTGGEGGEWEWIIGPPYDDANPGTNCRTSGATVNGIPDVRYTLATINTDGTPVNGIILFPDGCKINSSSATNWGPFNSDSELGTECTTAQWTHLEELGCVFLPAAGYRDGAEVKRVGSFGYYWSSSPDPSDTDWAHDVYFGSNGEVAVVAPQDSYDRYYGYSVRLVREVAAPAPANKLLSAATAEDIGKVVCAAGHLHDAKTAVPTGCTAVGILGKVSSTGHGLILALQNATQQSWNTINGWASVTTYAGTTLKLLPDNAARGTNLTSYTTLGSVAVSDWCVAQKSDYEAIFTNLGSKTGDTDGITYDANVNAYITTGVGGTPISGICWSATESGGFDGWVFYSNCWLDGDKGNDRSLRPVLGF